MEARENNLEELRDAGLRYYENKDYVNAMGCYEAARGIINEPGTKSEFEFWSIAVPEMYPTLISLYGTRKEFDTVVVILHEYFTHLNDIYDDYLPDQGHVNPDYIAGGIINVLKMLVEDSSIAGKELLPLFRSAERFINFADNEATIFGYYSLYANVCGPIDADECQRVKQEAESAKLRMSF